MNKNIVDARENAVICYNKRYGTHRAIVFTILVVDFLLLLYVLFIFINDWKNWFCHLPWIIFFLLFPVLFWHKRAKEVVTDVETILCLKEKNKLNKFKKYFLEEKEFAKLPFKELLEKKACVTPYNDETVCPTDNVKKDREKLEILARKLTPERQKILKQLIKQGVDEKAAKVGLLSEQINLPVYLEHKEKNKI